VVAHPAFTRSEHPVRAERARGSAFRSSARTTNEVRGTGSRRGFARRNGSANLHSSWSGPRKACLFGGSALRGSSARAVPARGQTKAKAGKGSSPLPAARGTEAARGRARASSYCRSRQNVLGFKEARHRCLSGRKPDRQSGTREREPDHRSSLRRASAGAHRWQKGDGSSELGDPHHVSAASSMKAARFRSCFGAGGMRVASVGGRHPGLAKRTPFTRPPRNRSWRPPSKRLGFEEKRTQAHGTEEATGVSEAVGSRFHAAEENALVVNIGRSPK